jgi:dihydrofolate reductase
LEVALIAAVAANRVIGAGNRLPWRLPEDLKRFRSLTTGHAVIMGRKTWESLPRALPERQNIVVTRQHDFVAAGAEIAHSFAEALARVRLPGPVFCIGGGEIYRAALPFATTLHMTEIAREFEGDAWFPPIERSEWRETERDDRPAAGPGGFAYSYVTYERKSPAAPGL